jgi:hypothetical protein
LRRKEGRRKSASNILILSMLLSNWAIMKTLIKSH